MALESEKLGGTFNWKIINWEKKGRLIDNE